MRDILFWILAALTIALAAFGLWAGWRLYCQRREAMRLSDQLNRFLNGEQQTPAFSVREDSFALLENSVVELMERLITSRENAREERQTAHRFLLDASHQLKTPIAGLRLYCELDGSAHQAQQLALIERMEALLAALMRLEKLRAGGYEFDFQMASLGEIAGKVCAEFRETRPEKRVTCAGDATLRMDAHWMAELIGNLVKNACEHAAAVSVEITSDDAEARLTVRDDGGGVPEEALPRLFERFYRGSAPRETGGIGVGLAIVRQIAEKHHGTVSARNSGKGLEITVRLPKLHEFLRRS